MYNAPSVLLIARAISGEQSAAPNATRTRRRSILRRPRDHRGLANPAAGPFTVPPHRGGDHTTLPMKRFVRDRSA
jgi:hypothetical protein